MTVHVTPCSMTAHVRQRLKAVIDDSFWCLNRIGSVMTLQFWSCSKFLVAFFTSAFVWAVIDDSVS